MNKKETLQLISFINQNYHNYFNENKLDDVVETWYEELCHYDYSDVKEELKELMSKQEFQMKPPTLYHITSKCKRKDDKVDLNGIIYLCDNCYRPFNSYDEMMEHRAKENSIDYVITQTKKWFNKDLNKADLFKMEEKEFKERYDRLLHYIYEHTTDKEEKIRIGYIFNPPSQEEARKFINKKD